MFLIMLIEAITILGSILFTILTLNKGLHMIVEGGGGTPSMLGEASKKETKAKELDKPPLNNPNIAGNSNGGMTQGGGLQQQPMLPDMKGADYGSYSGDSSGIPDMSGVSSMTDGISGSGVIGVAIGGLVNGIGAVVQGGNIGNYSVSGKQVIKGPVIQGGGMIYNNKLNGQKHLIQTANNGITNNTKGRTAINQGGPSGTSISSGRVHIVQSGMANSYLSGPVGKVKNGKISALNAKAPLHVQRLLVGKLTANKGTSASMKQMMEAKAYGGGQLPAGYQNNTASAPQYIGVNINDIQLRKINNVSRARMNLKAPNGNTLIGIQNIFGDPKNESLSDPNKRKLYSIYRVTEKSNNSPVNKGSIDMTQFQDYVRRTLILIPSFSAKTAMRTATIAASMASEQNRQKIDRANRIAEDRTNADNLKRNTLNDILSDPTSQAGIRYDSLVEETFRETNGISDERMKEIEKEAWEITEARKDIPLEEKEAEYEKIKSEKIKEEGGVTKDDIEELIKDRIISSPELAQAIIGEEGAKKLEEAINKGREEKDKIVVQELIKQDVEEHKEFLKSNPQSKKKSYYDAYKERRDKEMDKNIMTAASQLYANQSRDFDKQKYQQLMQVDNNSVQDQNQLQPIVPAQIFIARGVQERSATEDV